MKKVIGNHIKESSKDSHFTTRMVVMTIFAAIFAYSFATLILNVETQTLNYTEEGAADYEVCLKENTYFADECQPSGKQYVASLIKNIRVQLHYGFEAAIDVDYQYNYSITAKVIATDGDSDDRVLYESEEVLAPTRKLDGRESEFVIDEDVDIDYGKYNSLITSFRSDYGLMLRANVIVTLNVNLVGQADGFTEEIKSDQKIALNIPLSERTINVSLDSEELHSENNLEEKTYDLTKNLPWIIAADISAVVSLSTLIMSIIIFALRESRRSDYDKELSRIMKEYDQAIVEVDRLPKTPTDRVVEVGDFNELLNVHDTIEKPIIYKELVPSHCSVFMIEDGETVYIYVIGIHNRQILSKVRKASKK
jgi:hypothetical protein